MIHKITNLWHPLTLVFVWLKIEMALKNTSNFDKITEYMSHFSYARKTEGENGISRLISETA